MKYDFKKIEKKWQKEWERTDIYKAKDGAPRQAPVSKRAAAGRRGKKFYALVEFPYPSGDGLHTGHIRGYTAMDVVARKRRMEGYNVLYPMGWDAFGLPAENYAVKTGVHPKITTKKNIANFRRQLKSLGYSFDWSRELSTTDPQYYKWTQWMFLEFFKRGLAYKGEAVINWCPKCRAGLANEETEGGRCERCGGPVGKRMKRQWMLKMTAYAERLLSGLNKVDFPEEVKTAQRNWIGRSEGALFQFPIPNYSPFGGSPVGRQFPIKVFTTRPDTLFGATYLVVAPEHELISKCKIQNAKSQIKIQNWKEVERYTQQATRKTELERVAEGKDKTGVELKGIKAVNPATKEEIPIFVADYVLGSYGTGAIMAVPAHDDRDRAFAEKFNLPITDKPLISWDEALKISGGKKAVQYKMRDWVFSRQRYWGEPIPLIFCKKCGWVPVPEKELPVKLPDIKNFKPREDGESPLASAIKWVKTKCPRCKGPAERETDTMPTWAGSSWYFLAYLMKGFKKLSTIRNWKLEIGNFQHFMPVDWYNGGMEHTTRHLLYSRFWHMALFDAGFVPIEEPYRKRTSHGLILGKGGEKMSKSKGNVVNPDDYVKQYGADALRTYELFMGPFEQAIPWDDHGVIGTARFLEKAWHLFSDKRPASPERKRGEPATRDKERLRILEKTAHRTIKKVSEDIERMSFNTAVSQLMIFLSEIKAINPPSSHVACRIFLQLLAPFAPHLAEELWHRIGEKKSIHTESWPNYNPRLVESETFELVIQINGRTRDRVSVERGIEEREATRRATARPIVKKWLGGKESRRVVFVQNRLINLIL